MVMQNNENLTSNDAAKNAQNLSVNQMISPAVEGDTHPGKGISKNEGAKEPPDILTSTLLVICSKASL